MYADDGVSGTIPVHERPEGRRLLEDARVGRFRTLLVYRLDRLGRSLLVIVDAHDRLQTAGVSLRSATEPIDTSTPSGRLIFQMYGASWSGSTVAGIVHQSAYSGTHRVKANGGEESISRQVPALDAGLQQRAIEALTENKRYSNRENDRRYLLRSLVICETCGYACTGRTTSAGGSASLTTAA